MARYAGVILNPHLQGLIVPIAAVAVLLMILGEAWPVFYGEGSPTANYLEHRELSRSSGDAQIAAIMEARIDGKQAPPVEISPQDSSVFISRLRLADRVVAILCLVLAATLPFACRWRPMCAWGYLLPTLWILINAYSASMNGGKAHAELAVPAHATRIILPLALALLILRPVAAKPWVNRMLRVATAMTFAVHGWEAFRLNPSFQNLIHTFANQLGLEVSPTVCHGLLHAIGLMDGLLAISVILVHSPRVLCWMAFWGFVTALSRPLTISWLAWPELAIRLANGVCPWLILVIGLPALLNRWRQNKKISNKEPVSGRP